MPEKKTYPARMVTQTAFEADGKTVRHEVGDILPVDAEVDNDVVTQLVEVDTDPAKLKTPGAMREQAQAQKMNTGSDDEPADMSGAENTAPDVVEPGDDPPGGRAGGGRIAVAGQSATAAVDGDPDGGSESDSAGPGGSGGSSPAGKAGSSTSASTPGSGGSSAGGAGSTTAGKSGTAGGSGSTGKPRSSGSSKS